MPRIPRPPADPFDMRPDPRVFDHTFSWSFLLEPGQCKELFVRADTYAPAGCVVDGAPSCPYARFHNGAVITAVAASDGAAVVTLIPDGYARDFSGPWMTTPEGSELARPIVVPPSATLTGRVHSHRRDTHVVMVWLRARIARV